MSRAGLYAHIPFCLTRCGYCDFNTYARLGHLSSPYVEALRGEADLAAPSWSDVEFTSVFFGGGTPTTLPADELLRLLGHFRQAYQIDPGAEVTTELNPDTVDPVYLRTLLDGGVTRLSMGVQSFDPAVLESLERLHSPETAHRAFAAALCAGIGNVKLNLIYG